MGSCFSKKGACSSSSSSSSSSSFPPVQVRNSPEISDTQFERKKPEEGFAVKKEVFIIKHRKSYEVERQRVNEEKDEEAAEKTKSATNGILFSGELASGNTGVAPVRTSSCTKEEVDAILIQCGRLSRSSSAGKAPGLASENTGIKYSGSKRSYDFDNETGKSEGSAAAAEGDEDAVARERENRRNSQGRRRTPSRERVKDQTAQNRSGSRERGSSGGGRRVSKSPGRRSESSIPTSSNGANPNSSAANSNSSRPGKMVSVPATVSFLSMDKSTNGGGGEANPPEAVKRIQVKRNVVSPRTRSPARGKAANENQPLSLSRSNSKKAEHSPYRRNPLGEIDTNILSQAPPTKKPNADRTNNGNLTNMNCKNQEEFMPEETKEGGSHIITGSVGLNIIPSGPECLKPQMGNTRSRSCRLSRDLDINIESQDTNVSSYTALLLEDIQNFHQKSTTSPPEFSLPACVTKACSILEAVADLNSSTGSNLSTTLAEDRRRKPITKSNENKPRSTANLKGNMNFEIRDPILESEIVADDDLMEPSFHKYVTVRRGTMGVDDLGEQESSGSNSIAGSQQQWVPSSCWEPNSAESTDRWTSSSSRAGSRKNDVSPPLDFQRHVISGQEGSKKLSSRKKDSDHQRSSGMGQERNGTRVPYVTPVAPASTRISIA